MGDQSKAAEATRPGRPAGAPVVSVIVPHYQDLDNLDVCLDLLTRQTLDRAAYEVIVADNGSPVGLEAVRAVVGGRARVVLAEEKGAGPARNAGAEAARGQILAFTDSDCRPATDWLARAVQAMTRATVIGGRVDVLVADEERLRPVEAFERVFAFDNRDYVQRKGFSVTANLVLRRAVFAEAGPFRNGVSEDLEWCHRAARAGHPVAYADDVVVGHPAREDWPALARKWDRLSREAYLLARERPGGRLGYGLRAFVVLGSPLGHLPRVLASPRLGRMADRLGAAAVLCRIRWRRAWVSWRLAIFDA